MNLLKVKLKTLRFKKINFKISHALLSTYLIISLLVAFTSFTGIISMKTLYMNSKQMQEDTMKTIKVIDAIKSNMLDYRVSLIELIYIQDKDKTKDLKDKMAYYNIKIENDLIMFSGQNFSDEEKKIIEDLKKSEITFESMSRTIKDLVDSGDFSQAQKKYKELIVTIGKINDLLNNVIQISNDKTDKLEVENQNLFEKSTGTLVAIMIVSFAFSVVLGLLMARYINKRIKEVSEFANHLGNGDLTKKITIKSNDEFSQMSVSLNNAVDRVRELIKQAMLEVEEISAVGEELSATSEELLATMETIKTNTEEITEGAETLGISTKDISNSTDAIGKLTIELSKKASDQENSVKEILTRAIAVKEDGITSSDDALRTYAVNSDYLKNALEKAKIVNEIAAMADAIGNIAEQTNLLSLNAAIEAARAGEYGRGFGVVASEVRKLADLSRTSVDNIQKTTKEVQNAFNHLSIGSNEVLTFLRDKVNPGYRQLVETGESYQRDANLMEQMANDLMKASQIMADTANEVNNSIQNVSATAQVSLAKTNEILCNINEATASVNEVARAAQSQAELTEKINSLIKAFTI